VQVTAINGQMLSEPPEVEPKNPETDEDENSRRGEPNHETDDCRRPVQEPRENRVVSLERLALLMVRVLAEQLRRDALSSASPVRGDDFAFAVPKRDDLAGGLTHRRRLARP
jgi:hypothetical protein